MNFERIIKAPFEAAQHLGVYVLSIVDPKPPEYEPIGANITYYSTKAEGQK